MIEQCCGTTCDKHRLESQLKAAGATEFVAYMERHLTEDCSTEAVAKILAHYKMTIVGIHATV